MIISTFQLFPHWYQDERQAFNSHEILLSNVLCTRNTEMACTYCESMHESIESAPGKISNTRTRKTPSYGPPEDSAREHVKVPGAQGCLACVHPPPHLATPKAPEELAMYRRKQCAHLPLRRTTCAILRGMHCWSAYHVSSLASPARRTVINLLSLPLLQKCISLTSH